MARPDINKMTLKEKIGATIIAPLVLVGIIAGASIASNNNDLVGFSDGDYVYNIPHYSDEPFIILNDNEPIFNEFELKEEPYEEYSDLDSLGRCTLTSAICSKETMPKEGEKRGSISNVKPTGWVQAKYDCISGKILYNRCHLIGWQLTAENANKKNLITGTRYLNIDGMLPFENMVADYIKETNGYVAYQVRPVYNGKDLVAVGVQMEGYSISDSGESICFNVFCYNVQPGIEIDYSTGNSKLIDDVQTTVALIYFEWKKFFITT